MITGCNPTIHTLGSTVPTEGGWRQTLNNSIETVYNRDPGARWDDNAVLPDGRRGTVVGSNLGAAWMESDRVWIMAMMHPAQVPAVPSDKDTQFNNFMRFFFEGCIDESGNGPIGVPCTTKTMMLGRFLGPAPTVGSGPVQGTMLTNIKLVE
jgi:hypothetical protein